MSGSSGTAVDCRRTETICKQRKARVAEFSGRMVRYRIERREHRMKRGWRVGIAVVVLMIAAVGGEKLWAQKQDDTELLRVREQVWRAWFAGDTKTLEELVPAETIVMSGGEEKWKHQGDVLRTSVEFHAKGGKLLRLEFPRNEVQHFGDVAIVWSSYSLELE